MELLSAGIGEDGEFEPKALVSQDFVDGKPVYIAPLGDIQWNNEPAEIALKHLKAYIASAMKVGAWFIGMGDMTDFASPSNRYALGAAKTYDSAKQRLDSAALDTVMGVYDEVLKPTKGRWLGLLEGHHYWQLKDGTTTDQRLCAMLDAPFLGTCAILRLAFKAPCGGGDYLIWAHHGKGSGQEGAMLNRLARISGRWERINLFLMGHWTKRGGAPIPRISPEFGRGTPHLRHRDVYVVGTGGWLKGYREFSKDGRVPRGNYVETNMMDPVSLGAPFITVIPRVERVPIHRVRTQKYGQSTKRGKPTKRQTLLRPAFVQLWDPVTKVTI